MSLGVSLGSLEGRIDGDAEKMFDGVRVPGIVGCIVGDGDGLLVGVDVLGRADGTLVGSVVGM